MSENLVEEIEDIASLNSQNFYVKLVLPGFKKPVVYTVSKAESDGVRKTFARWKETDSDEGLEFETLSGRLVNFRPSNVIFYHALWDAGRLPLEPEDSDSESDLILYIRGIEKPQEYNDVDPAEIYDIANAVQYREEHRFVSFVDEDGERAYVRVDNIMLMESLDYIKLVEGEDENDADPDT